MIYMAAIVVGVTLSISNEIKRVIKNNLVKKCIIGRFALA